MLNEEDSGYFSESRFNKDNMVSSMASDLPSSDASTIKIGLVNST